MPEPSGVHEHRPFTYATLLLVSGFASLLSKEPKPGLVLILMGLGLIDLVNLHALMAHLAGIDYRLALMEYDMQLGPWGPFFFMAHLASIEYVHVQ